MAYTMEDYKRERAARLLAKAKQAETTEGQAEVAAKERRSSAEIERQIRKLSREQLLEIMGFTESPE